MFIAASLFFHLSLLVWNDELLWRRVSIGLGTKIWDHGVMALIAINLVAIFYIGVVDFDTRVRSLTPPGIIWLTGLTVHVAGWMLFTRCAFENPFFEKMVRIQWEVGHQVIDTGPYSIIRHPGYVGFIAILLATPLLLPSISILFRTLGKPCLYHRHSG